jgi:hypothetical protein
MFLADSKERIDHGCLIFLGVLAGWTNLIERNPDKCTLNANAITDDFLKDNKNIQYRSAIENMDWAQEKERLTTHDKYEITIPHHSYPGF